MTIGLSIAVAFLAGIAGSVVLRLLWPGPLSPPTDAPSSPAGAIRATSLTLIDSDGHERGVFRLVDGRPLLLLADDRMLPSGDTAPIPRLAIGILEDGAPGVELADPDGKMRVLLSLTAEGTACLKLSSRNSKAAARLSAPADGASTLTFADETGNELSRLP